MSDDERSALAKDPDSEFTFEPMVADEFEEILQKVGVSSKCNLCGTDNLWFMLRSRTNNKFLAETYILTGNYKNPYPTLSYYSRSCIICGNMQNFCTSMFEPAQKALKELRGENG